MLSSRDNVCKVTTIMGIDQDLVAKILKMS